MTDDKRINWEAVIALGAIITIVGSNYLFTENAVRKFEHRMEIRDERWDSHKTEMDAKWVSLLQEMHSHDKRIVKVEDMHNEVH